MNEGGKKKKPWMWERKNRSLWGKLPEAPKITTCVQLILNYFFKLLIASGVPVDFFLLLWSHSLFFSSVCLSVVPKYCCSLLFLSPFVQKNFFPLIFFPYMQKNILLFWSLQINIPGECFIFILSVLLAWIILLLFIFLNTYLYSLFIFIEI